MFDQTVVEKTEEIPVTFFTGCVFIYLSRMCMYRINEGKGLMFLNQEKQFKLTAGIYLSSIHQHIFTLFNVWTWFMAHTHTINVGRPTIEKNVRVIWSRPHCIIEDEPIRNLTLISLSLYPLSSISLMYYVTYCIVHSIIHYGPHKVKRRNPCCFVNQ